ncbi:PaaI family thioesterase [Enterovirga rhinocerotis]|uniref:Uncharacterized protein (TIGR00369 family) n=1 Tax=Enterovirga rhinocerotis TaxID=1339210 RepID=A0A4R7C7C6_9HYPH|nr:PaaI family thioesterase [Enterovirga rhinocerotis]TDR93872.1 uncharacterized protein (TIGR00369 family) [Enterovirga rhinocerotis]
MSDAGEDLLELFALNDSPMAQGFGFRTVSASRDCVVAELLVEERHSNRNGVLHGGTIMALADNTAGTATFLNLPEGFGTTTVESKTNFFAAIKVGDLARAEATPLHRGRTTMVWQTRITRPDGKLAAMVTQTQLVMKK